MQKGRNPDYGRMLGGGDRRSLGNAARILPAIQSQAEFDRLFLYLFDNDRLVAMRAADIAEKCTRDHHEWLTKHAYALLQLADKTVHPELRWHLAQILPRLPLTAKREERIWNRLFDWVTNQSGSRIVRVNALQGLYELYQASGKRMTALTGLIGRMLRDKTPSVRARARKLHRLITV